MSDSKIEYNFSGLVTGLLGILFVYLKLTGVIAWSWWWVTAPFWGGLALVLAFVLGAASILGLVAAIAAWKERR